MQVLSPRLREAIKDLQPEDVIWDFERISGLATKAAVDPEDLWRDPRNRALEIPGLRDELKVTWCCEVNGHLATFVPNVPVLASGQKTSWDFTHEGRIILVQLLAASGIESMQRTLLEDAVVLPSELPAWLGWSHHGTVLPTPNRYLCLVSELPELVGPYAQSLKALLQLAEREVVEATA